ncbi:hypothetical protein [Streptomyces sp. NPDC127190]|uniref:hypothetical protein n=1 Tax=unclassified Streptomyces TaxID=2593676 RepID=UPI00362E50AA
MKRLGFSVLATAAALVVGGATLATAQGGDADKPGTSGSHVSGRAKQATVGRYWGDDVIVQPGKYGTASASCPAGMVSTGGGGSEGNASQSGGEPFMLASYGGPNGWTVGVKNTDTVARPIIAFVVCITP